MVVAIHYQDRYVNEECYIPAVFILVLFLFYVFGKNDILVFYVIFIFILAFYISKFSFRLTILVNSDVAGSYSYWLDIID